MMWSTLLLARSLGLLCWKWIVRNQKWKQGDQIGATTIVQTGNGYGGGNKWPYSGYILRVELKGLANENPLHSSLFLGLWLYHKIWALVLFWWVFFLFFFFCTALFSSAYVIQTSQFLNLLICKRFACMFLIDLCPSSGTPGQRPAMPQKDICRAAPAYYYYQYFIFVSC